MGEWIRLHIPFAVTSTVVNTIRTTARYAILCELLARILDIEMRCANTISMILAIRAKICSAMNQWVYFMREAWRMDKSED